MPTPGAPRRGGLEVWLVSLMFLVVGVGIVLYGARPWLPPLASRHGAGIDAMLNYLLMTTGRLVARRASRVLAWLVWSGGRRARVTTRLAAHRTEIAVSIALGLVMAVIAEGGVLAIGLPVWQEYFDASPLRRRGRRSTSSRSSSSGTCGIRVPTARSAAREPRLDRRSHEPARPRSRRPGRHRTTSISSTSIVVPVGSARPRAAAFEGRDPQLLPARIFG